ncbi:SIR2 family protein [Streptomyces lasiicapitis]|uniref:hypothetical protein n=1 Tax=Streptomyces lasiicapitis TaxID=1923961 RepID=UPI00364A50C0
MFLPYPVIDHLTPAQVETWEKHFAQDHLERPRSIEEGIWRRTQAPGNAEQSGWREDAHGRRRIVHYRYHYALDYTFPVPRLVLSDLYLYHSITGPRADMAVYAKNIDDWLDNGRWRPKGDSLQHGDLQVRVAAFDQHPQDERADRATPAGYRTIDICFTSDGYEVSRTLRNLPWDVLTGGMRVREQRGRPAYADDLSELLNFLPFHVELGCGTSIEAGIPPLHYLHEVYRVTARLDNALTQSHLFTLTPQADLLIRELLMGAAAKMPELVRMFRTCFTAEPTPAHHALKALHEAGALVGPVITHNFDVLSARAGLEECFVRRYDQKIPPVPFVDGAKALLVIGLHADRREVQRRARERGMKIFFVDTEGLEENGVFREYPIEGAREGDTIVRQAAIPALTRLCRLPNMPSSHPTGPDTRPVQAR